MLSGFTFKIGDTEIQAEFYWLRFNVGFTIHPGLLELNLGPFSLAFFRGWV